MRYVRVYQNIVAGNYYHLVLLVKANDTYMKTVTTKPNTDFEGT